MLLTVVLLLAVSGLPCHAAEKFVIDNDAIDKVFYEGQLGLRVIVASGARINGKEYGPASNMYKLEGSQFLKAIAKSVLSDRIVSLPSSFGRIDYESKVPSGADISDEAKKALQTWTQSTNSFNQILYAKATQVGCAYKLFEERGDGLTTIKMACLYDRNYRSGEPYTKGSPCQKDSDCTTYTFSTCEKRYHLCKKN